MAYEDLHGTHQPLQPSNHELLSTTGCSLSDIRKNNKAPRFSAQYVGWHSMISATTGWLVSELHPSKLNSEFTPDKMDAWKTILSFPFLGFWWLFRGYVVFHFQGVFQSPKIMKLNWSPSIFSLWMDHSQVFCHGHQLSSRNDSQQAPNRQSISCLCQDRLLFKWCDERYPIKPTLKYMGVSKNRGTPKWMVYNGKPY